MVSQIKDKLPDVSSWVPGMPATLTRIVGDKEKTSVK